MGVAQAQLFDKRTRRLRGAISLYAILWVIEGALRRWVFPAESDALLVVRDPLVIYIYLSAAQVGMMTWGAIEIWALTLTAISFLATFITGHADMAVALYGSSYDGSTSPAHLCDG